MDPANPPFPTPSKSPFQPDAGIQISIFTEGATVSCTLQKAGTSMVLGVAGMPGPSGTAATGARATAPAAAVGLNGPAGTDVTAVIVVSGNFKDCKLSQD